METSGVALIALVCVVFSSQKRISEEVEMRVRRGDDVTLYSNCVWKSGFYPAWFRNCSVKDHPRLLVSGPHLDYEEMLDEAFPRYFTVFNKSTNTHDLLIKNVTESDLGLYYCALRERIISDDKSSFITNNDVYHYGNRSTRLSLLEESCPSVTVSPTQWKLVLSVCVVCVFISSLFSSICVYCLCTNTTEAGSEKRTTRRQDVDGEDEVCYVALDIRPLEEKRKTKRKKSIQCTDFSTYSEVRTETSERC